MINLRPLKVCPDEFVGFGGHGCHQDMNLYGLVAPMAPNPTNSLILMDAYFADTGIVLTIRPSPDTIFAQVIGRLGGVDSYKIKHGLHGGVNNYKQNMPT